MMITGYEWKWNEEDDCNMTVIILTSLLNGSYGTEVKKKWWKLCRSKKKNEMEHKKKTCLGQ